MAGQGKDKEKKAKDDPAALLRRLAEEVAALRADVEAVKSSGSAPVPEASRQPSPSAKAGGVSGLLTTLDGEDGRSLPTVEDSQVAKLGYALSSAPKVALLRLLWEGGEQSAAQLGEKAGLTTGSLYHHLRELIYADIIAQESRNRYRLTPLGRRTVLLLFTLAGSAT
jgi:DNA-binding transcriptional ArsR family regulator